MKQYIILIALLLLAPTIIDQSDSDFNQGTPTNINVTLGQLELTQTAGNYTASGTYISQIFDLGPNPIGNISWTSSVVSQTSVLVTSRSSSTNTGSWSSWSSQYTNPSGSQLTHPEERYMQYRVQFTTTNQSKTPGVQAVQIDYESNNAPVLASISNKTAVEGEELAFSITASDADSDTLTYTASRGSITKFTNTIADYTWTPQGSAVGLTNVTITVSDGRNQDSKIFTINTTESNKAPVIQTINDITSYYGDRISLNVIVDDQNLEENLTFSSNPSLNLVEIPTNASTTYTAQANFSALDDEKGTTQYTITVQDDGGEFDTENFTHTVNYCGDNVCQSQESADTCAQDCITTQDSRKSYIAIQFPTRICTNTTLNITAYNASSRYVCFLEGKTTKTAAAWCAALEGVNFQFYELTNGVRTEVGSASTNAQGIANFIAQTPGRYRLVATTEGLVSTEETFIAQTCDKDITNQEQIIRTEAPQIEIQQQPASTPRSERPDITPQQVSILSILIWYMVIPLLLASLIYVSNEYYAINKDNDPKILAVRIKLEEFKQQYWPKVEPYWIKIQDTLAPIVTPVWNVVYQKALLPIGKKLQPIYQKFTKR
jgi:hypothetical protein